MIYTEINYAVQVASLLQGTAAEEELITAVQLLICRKAETIDNIFLGRLDRKRFGLILKLPVEASVEFAEELA
ncbi:MAG: EAL domain-containing protein, partial [Gammaproteobacteria bacterium]